MIDVLIDWLTDLVIELGGRVLVWFTGLPPADQSWADA